MSNVFAQTGYNYQSRQTGDWSDYTTWQRWSTTDANKTINPLGPSDAIPNSSADRITILQGHSVTVDTDRTVDELVVESGATLTVAYAKQLTINNGVNTDLTIHGTLNSKGGTNNAFANFIHNTNSTTAFSSTGVYQHNPSVKIGVVPTATWDPASTVEFIYSGTTIGGTVAAANKFDQDFGNVKWNTPAMTSNINLGSQLTKIHGNFEVISTGSVPLILSTSGTNTLTIDKDLTISGSSDVVFSTQSAPTNGLLKLNIGKSLTVASTANFRNNTVASPLKVTFNGVGTLNTPTLLYMDFEVAPAAAITLTNNFSVAGVQGAGSQASNFKVLGRLNTGLNVVSGNGNFSLENGGTLGIGLAAGISSAGGNITVAGTKTFSTLANYVYDRQNFAQNTGDLLPSSVAGLTINNPLGIQLTSPVTVTGTLTLSNGILKTGTNALTMTSGATVSKSENVSYVEGAMAHLITTSGFNQVLFPIGAAGTYRPVNLSFNQTTSTATTYTANLVNGQPTTRNLPAEVDRISSIRYFTINKSNGSAITNGVVSLTYTTDDVVTQPSTLALVKSSANGLDWEYLDGNVSTASDGTTRVTSINPFSTFSDFILANKVGGTNPLPVALVSFNAEKANKAVNLTWKTASEKNNDFFAVERSADGRNFEAIGQVKGAGNSNALNTYAFADKNPVNGVSYYRLKQTDFDGKFEYSKIVSVTLEGQITSVAITAFPNPANNVLNVKVNGLNGKATMEITDVTGRSLKQVQINAAETNTLNVEMLPKGLYQIRVISENGSTVSKFLKQ